MPKMVVNADAYVLSVPNQTQGQPPVARTEVRGTVVDVSPEEAKRGEGIRVRNTYTSGGVTVTRDEPALIPAGKAEDHANTAAEAVRQARRDALLAELASVDPEAAKAATSRSAKTTDTAPAGSAGTSASPGGQAAKSGSSGTSG